MEDSYDSKTNENQSIETNRSERVVLPQTSTVDDKTEVKSADQYGKHDRNEGPEFIMSQMSVPSVSGSHGNLNSPSSNPTPSNLGIRTKTDVKFYFDQLKDLVPYARDTDKMSKTQIIHSAIDYITDLQESLEARVKRNVDHKTDRCPLSSITVPQQPNNQNISMQQVLPAPVRNENILSGAVPLMTNTHSTEYEDSHMDSSISNILKAESNASSQWETPISNIMQKVNEAFLEQTFGCTFPSKAANSPGTSDSNLIMPPSDGTEGQRHPSGSLVKASTKRRLLDSDCEDNIDSSYKGSDLKKPKTQL